LCFANIILTVISAYTDAVQIPDGTGLVPVDFRGILAAISEAAKFRYQEETLPMQKAVKLLFQTMSSKLSPRQIQMHSMQSFVSGALWRTM
jgi:hypothetical protein